MAELGLVTNVIAVVDLSARITLSCPQVLSRGLKILKRILERFEQEINSVSKLLRHVKTLLEGAHKTSLSTLDGLKTALAECERSYKSNTVLPPGKGRKIMIKIGFWTLNWPF